MSPTAFLQPKCGRFELAIAKENNPCATSLGVRVRLCPWGLGEERPQSADCRTTEEEVQRGMRAA